MNEKKRNKVWERILAIEPICITLRRPKSPRGSRQSNTGRAIGSMKKERAGATGTENKYGDHDLLQQLRDVEVLGELAKAGNTSKNREQEYIQVLVQRLRGLLSAHSQILTAANVFETASDLFVQTLDELLRLPPDDRCRTVLEGKLRVMRKGLLIRRTEFRNAQASVTPMPRRTYRSVE
jgi:hypothetical protein